MCDYVCSRLCCLLWHSYTLSPSLCIYCLTSLCRTLSGRSSRPRRISYPARWRPPPCTQGRASPPPTPHPRSSNSGRIRPRLLLSPSRNMPSLPPRPHLLPLGGLRSISSSLRSSTSLRHMPSSTAQPLRRRSSTVHLLPTSSTGLPLPPHPMGPRRRSTEPRSPRPTGPHPLLSSSTNSNTGPHPLPSSTGRRRHPNSTSSSSRRPPRNTTCNSRRSTRGSTIPGSNNSVHLGSNNSAQLLAEIQLVALCNHCPRL